MSKYEIHCSIKRATGTQVWEVEANSEQDALARHNRGESELISEEIEVHELGETSVEPVPESPSKAE